MTAPKFEELLRAYQHEAIAYGVAGGVTGGGGIETGPLLAARSALVAYFEERVHSERQAVAAMLYLGGKLATNDKLSPVWIQEAIKATAAAVDEVPR